MTDIENISQELEIIENVDFHNLDGETRSKHIDAFHDRISNLSIWKKLVCCDEFFSLATLTEAFFNENSREKKDNPAAWYAWVCKQNFDVQYLVVEHLINDIPSVLDFFRFLSEAVGNGDVGVISIVLTHRFVSILFRQSVFPRNGDFSCKNDVDDLINALNGDRMFFSVFYPLLSNIWVFNAHTACYENIRHAFIDKLLEMPAAKCIDAINSENWEHTKGALYSRLMIFLSLDEQPSDLRESLWRQVLDFVENETPLPLIIGGETNDFHLILTIASFLAADDDCLDKMQSALSKGNVRTYAARSCAVNFRGIEKQCYLFSLAAFAAQSLQNQGQQELAGKLYNDLLDQFDDYIAYNVPAGYDTSHSFSSVPSAIVAIWFNMAYFDISDEKAIESFDAIKVLDNKLLAASVFLAETRKRKDASAVSRELKSHVRDLLPVAESWFDTEYASQGLRSWRKNILSVLKTELDDD